MGLFEKTARHDHADEIVGKLDLIIELLCDECHDGAMARIHPKPVVPDEEVKKAPEFLAFED